MTFLSDFLWGWTAYGFMRTALCAVLLIAPLYGLLGTMAVDGRMAFFSDSLGHSAITGIALGVMLGIQTPAWAMILYGLAYALLLCYVKGRGAASTDTTIGVFSSTGLALGVVLLSRNGGFAKYSGYLIGDLLAIDEKVRAARDAAADDCSALEKVFHKLHSSLKNFASLTSVYHRFCEMKNFFTRTRGGNLNGSVCGGQKFSAPRQEFAFRY